MALEISEIGISMRVRGGDEETSPRRVESRNHACGDVGREAIVDDCVRRVLQILRTLEER